MTEAIVSSKASVVVDAFERGARWYHETADPYVYRHLAAPVVAELSANVDLDADRLLDVAAGTGAVGRAFARGVACDISTAQLGANAAETRICADAQALPFMDDSFAGAACAFGINCVSEPGSLVREMARVAPVVVISTWRRPEREYEPKRLVVETLERHTGRARTEAGVAMDRFANAVGSVVAVRTLLADAGLHAVVREVEVDVPWPGIDAYLDYRLSSPTTSDPSAIVDGVRSELRERLNALPSSWLAWRPVIVLGTGTR